jgi:exodeoxyribonuclease V gamma subunit
VDGDQISLQFPLHPSVPESSARIRIVMAEGIEPLADGLLERMHREPLPPHEFEAILLPHGSALRPWLTQRIADRLGCAASLYMPSIREFADSLIRRIVGKDPAALDAETLLWRIFSILENTSDEPRLAPLHAYLRRSGGDRMPLARRLAQLFDSYQTYRPELLAEWSAGSDAQSDWQAEIWRRIQGENERADRGSLIGELIDALSTAPDNLPTRIAVLGESVVAPIYLKFLSALSHHVEITWYAVETDPQSDHPLVRLLGDDAREARALRHEILGEMPPAYPSGSDASGDAGTMLHSLQTGIRGKNAGSVTSSQIDDTLRIHDCHSPIRELEVLRDQLLDAFETIDDLKPSDVIIAVSDLDRYGTLIDAVFSAGDRSQRLPVTIAHDPREEGRRYLAAFSSLLDLLQSRMTAGSVLELLSEPAIARRAEFDSEAVDVVRWWIRETRIRWGLDGAHRLTFGLPADDVHTWKHGIDRLFMGVLAGQADETIDGVLPYAEGTLDRAPVLARLAAFLQRITDVREGVTAPRTLEAWRDTMESVVADFLGADSDDETLAEDHLFSVLREMARRSPGSVIRFAELTDHLKASLAGFEGRGRLLGGGITVAEFERLRHVPARVIACVGLNDDAFPRRSAQADFDLIATNRQPGDPDPRRLDKQLFLDLVSSTRDRLILTYLGRSQKDNSERASSIVIDALLDALAPSSAEAVSDDDRSAIRNAVVVKHPLQPFNRRYFDGSDERLFSFDRANCIEPAESRGRIGPFTTDPIEHERKDEVIQLEDLIAAWSSPGQFFCERLGVRMKLSDQSVEDVEPLFLDGLDTYRIGTQIIEATLSGESPVDIRDRLRNRGSLPAGVLGDRAFESQLEDVQPLLDIVTRFGDLKPMEIDVVAGDRRIVGVVPWVSHLGTLLFRPARIKPKDQVAAWIYHLAVAIGRPDWTTHLAGKLGKSDYKLLSWSGVDDPLAHLETLVSRYDEVLQNPPVILPRSSTRWFLKESTRH